MNDTLRRFRTEFEDAQRALTEAHAALREKRQERERLLASPEHALEVARLDSEIAARRGAIKILKARREDARSRYQSHEAWQAKPNSTYRKQRQHETEEGQQR